MADITFGNISMNEIYYGGIEIDEVYCGSNLIWSADKSITVSSNSVIISPDINSYVDVTVTSRFSWTATGTSTYFSNYFSLSTINSTTLRITALMNNTGSSYRTGTIRLSNGDNYVDLTVKQGYDYISISPTS